MESKDLTLDNKSLLLDSNLGKITDPIKTNKIYHISFDKLKSQNLAITFNYEVLAKPIQEAWPLGRGDSLVNKIII